ncbi:MAG: hypothetical protein Q8930_17015 [Bacillota bacterium]|nr:hypothetical protein [Bacillota bacterium]
MSCCTQRGCRRSCRRRRCRRCRSGIRIPKAFVLGVLFALVIKDIRSNLNPTANNNINIININKPAVDECEYEKSCDHTCR